MPPGKGTAPSPSKWRFKRIICKARGHRPVCLHRVEKTERGLIHPMATFCSVLCERCKWCGKPLKWNGVEWVPYG